MSPCFQLRTVLLPEPLTSMPKLARRFLKQISGSGVCQAMRRAGLDDRDRRTVSKYSLGMKQRLAIAQAVMESPKLLVLDEPTNALDEQGVSMFRDIIREEKKRGALVILASHNKEDIELLADVRIHMSNGRIESVL